MTGPRKERGRKRALTEPHKLRNEDLPVTSPEKRGVENELSTRRGGQSVATGLRTSSRSRNGRWS